VSASRSTARRTSVTGGRLPAISAPKPRSSKRFVITTAPSTAASDAIRWTDLEEAFVELRDARVHDGLVELHARRAPDGDGVLGDGLQDREHEALEASARRAVEERVLRLEVTFRDAIGRTDDDGAAMMHRAHRRHDPLHHLLREVTREVGGDPFVEHRAGRCSVLAGHRRPGFAKDRRQPARLEDVQREVGEPPATQFGDDFVSTADQEVSGPHDANDEARRHRWFFRAAALRGLEPSGPALDEPPDAELVARLVDSDEGSVNLGGRREPAQFVLLETTWCVESQGQEASGRPGVERQLRGWQDEDSTRHWTLFIAKKRRVVGHVENGDELLGKGICVGGPAVADALGELIRVSPLHVDHPLIVVAVCPICKVATPSPRPRRTSGLNVMSTAESRP
jgi:hypothetical protein